jgi:hypothetical protein
MPGRRGLSRGAPWPSSTSPSRCSLLVSAIFSLVIYLAVDVIYFPLIHAFAIKPKRLFAQ